MPIITEAKLKKEYLINKLDSYKIAEKYGCSATWINILRTKYGIQSLKTYERSESRNLSPKQRQLIYGSLLGDTTIKFGGRTGNKNGFFSVSQTDKDLTLFKYEILKSFVNTEIKIYEDKRSNRKRVYYFNTISHPIFTSIYDKIYVNGIKTVSQGWLEELTPLSLAVWYMDDGSITQKNHQMRISTESFSFREHLLMKNYLKQKWGINPDIKNSPRQNKFILSFKSKERDSFFELIGHFIIPGMRYKIYKNLKPTTKWNVSEVAYLKKNYHGSRLNWNRLSQLKRTKQSIQRKASYLNLTRTSET